MQRDGVMAQVEMACGPYRIVSLMSREAADELGLEPGSRAEAVIKSTTVVIETRELARAGPGRHAGRRATNGPSAART